MRSLVADIGPLRRHRAYRRLMVGQLVSAMGSQLTVVAVAYQAYALTKSSLVVGLVSLVQLVPNLVGSLGGGAIADARNRRTILVAAQLTLGVASGALALNAFLHRPELWVLYVAVAASALFQGLTWPTRSAIMPMIIPAEDLPSAYTLQSVIGNAAMVVGPALAGLIIAKLSLGAAYVIDAGTFAATLVSALLLPSLPPGSGAPSISLRSVVEGLKHLRAERLLGATFALDFIAMSFGMPKAVFPALGVGFFHGGPGTVGLLFAAPGAGALVGSVLSGWVKRVRSRPRALVVCMLVWGGAITVFGVVPSIVVGLLLLGLAGAADVTGTVLRITILQARTPTALMGRLSGAFYAAAVAGNRVGTGETGAVAALAGPQIAVWTGGAACILGTVLLAWRVPGLWRHVGATPRGDAAGPTLSGAAGPGVADVAGPGVADVAGPGVADVAVEGA